jgi:hypothetical protein
MKTSKAHSHGKHYCPTIISETWYADILTRNWGWKEWVPLILRGLVTSQILKEAQHHAWQELATWTGNTDSEEDGLGIYDEELEYQEPNKYEDEQLHQDDTENEDGNYVRGQSGAKEEDWEYTGQWWQAICSLSRLPVYLCTSIATLFHTTFHSVLARLVKIIPITLRLLAIAKVVLYCRFTMIQYSTT